MTSEELHLCHRRALAAAARLRLPLRSKVWRGQAGEFSGSGTGSSLDFQDHRTYTPGDDPRHLNWQAYARTGHYTMKLFREEVRPVVDLIMDASESMFFDPLKALRSAELFYFVVEAARASGASVNIHILRGDAATRVDPNSIRTHRWLEEARSLSSHDPAGGPDLAKTSMSANAVRIFVSDLLFPGDPDPWLRHLGQRHGSMILLSPFLQSEAQPDWGGNYEFVDPERQTRHLHRIEPSVLNRYLEAYAKHFSIWKQAAQRHQSAFARIPVESDLVSALFSSAVPAGALEPSF